MSSPRFNDLAADLQKEVAIDAIFGAFIYDDSINSIDAAIARLRRGNPLVYLKGSPICPVHRVDLESMGKEGTQS